MDDRAINGYSLNNRRVLHIIIIGATILPKSFIIIIINSFFCVKWKNWNFVTFILNAQMPWT